MLGRIARRGDRRRGRESKAVVVAMIANEHTAFCAARSQILKARLDELLADTTPLKRGLHGADQAQTNPAAHWVLPWRMRCGQQSARRPRRRATRRALWPRATSRLLAVRYYHRFGFSPAPSVAPPGYPAEHFQVLPFGASLPGRLPCRLLHRRLMGSGLLDSHQPSSTEVLMRLTGR